MYNNSNTTGIKVYKPDMRHFEDFSEFMIHIESCGAHEMGLAKVIPPSEWVPRKGSYCDAEIMNIKIDKPIYQITSAKERCGYGLYRQTNTPLRSMTVLEYREMAERDTNRTPNFSNELKDLERAYWENTEDVFPVYGAGVPGTLIDDSVKVWNISKLGLILDLVGADGIALDHINTPYLDFGMWKSTFAWHTEYADLYRINYLHSGSPKQWYAIPPEYGRIFESLAGRLYPDDKRTCSAFLRHKMTLISPKVLFDYGIPFNTITQYPGEFIINFPYGYHCSFNYGYNIAESINCASSRWFPYGFEALECKCEKAVVQHQVKTFFTRTHPGEIYSVPIVKKPLGYYRKPVNVVTVPCLIKPYSAFKISDAKIFNAYNSSLCIKLNAVKLDRSSFAVKQLVRSSAWLDADGNVPRTPLLINKVIPNKIRHLVYDHCSLEIEQQYNILRSVKDSYCSLCLMFHNKQVTFDEDWKINAALSVLPPISSLPRRSEALFRFVIDGYVAGIQDDGLIRCVKCYLTVHKICYDISTNTEGTSWLCDRCKEDELAVACIYCPLKVGAMKLLQNGVWAHPACHILIQNYNTFKPSKIMSLASSTKCIVCNLTCGDFFNCSDIKCSNHFHISCGLVSGFCFLIDIQNTRRVLITCVSHDYKQNKKEQNM